MMTELESALALVGKIERDLRKAEAEVARLVRVKAEPALEAAKGDKTATRRLAELNARLREAEDGADDLRTALSGARLELGKAEASEQRRLNGERAAEIERLAEELRQAAVSIDGALEALAAAFECRNAVAEQLYRLAPSLRSDAHLRITGEGAATRAARRLGLHRFLKLAWAGERHHEQPLVDCFPVPEVQEAVARLRGGAGSRSDRPEAA